MFQSIANYLPKFQLFFIFQPSGWPAFCQNQLCSHTNAHKNTFISIFIVIAFQIQYFFSLYFLVLRTWSMDDRPINNPKLKSKKICLHKKHDWSSVCTHFFELLNTIKSAIIFNAHSLCCFHCEQTLNWN